MTVPRNSSVIDRRSLMGGVSLNLSASEAAKLKNSLAAENRAVENRKPDERIDQPRAEQKVVEAITPPPGGDARVTVPRGLTREIGAAHARIQGVSEMITSLNQRVMDLSDIAAGVGPTEDLGTALTSGRPFEVAGAQFDTGILGVISGVKASAPVFRTAVGSPWARAQQLYAFEQLEPDEDYTGNAFRVMVPCTLVILDATATDIDSELEDYLTEAGYGDELQAHILANIDDFLIEASLRVLTSPSGVIARSTDSFDSVEDYEDAVDALGAAAVADAVVKLCIPAAIEFDSFDDDTPAPGFTAWKQAPVSNAFSARGFAMVLLAEYVTRRWGVGGGLASLLSGTIAALVPGLTNAANPAAPDLA